MSFIPFARVFSAAGVVLLSGCGGGGGGGDDGSGSGGEPIPPGPPPFTLSDDNALDAAALVIRLVEQTGRTAELAIAAADVLQQVGRTEYTASCEGSPLRVRYVDADGNSVISAGDTVSAEHDGPCGGASRNVTMNVSAVDLENLRIDGPVQFQLDTAAEERMTGSFTLSTSLDATGTVLTIGRTDLSITSVKDGTTDRITAARYERQLGAFGRYTLSFSGRSEGGALGGTFSFSTPEPFSGLSTRLPESGELLLAAGATRVRLTAVADPAARHEADYQVDNGTGYSPARRARWRDLTTGMLFDWIPNDPPVITSLEISPGVASVNESVTAVATASDADGDTLFFTYEWQVNANLYSGYGPTFLLAGFQKGYTVTVHVTVSDGHDSATRSATITIANAAPTVTSLTIEPVAPRSIDDLTGSSTFEDVDDDPVSIRYEWWKNGTPIPGATGSTLSRSAFARGDEVTLVAFATDGEDTGSAETSVTIQDSLPQVTLPSPTLATEYGVPMQVEATAADPDGDPLPPELRFELRYGPAGMTVDAGTGVVSWTPSGPMFDKAMDVHYSVGVDIPGAGFATGTVTVEDPARQYPLARSSMDPAVYGGLRADDFDGDGDAEMLMLTRSGVLYELEAAGSSYRQSWMYPFALNPAGVPTSMTTADIDGDRRQEIFVSSGSVLMRLDGVGRRLSASFVLPVAGAFDSCGDLEAADLNRDGAVELVCSVSLNGSRESGDSHPILVIDPATLAVTGEVPGGNFGNELAIGNVDDDAALEIVTWRGFVFDGVTLAPEWENGQGFGQGLAVADVTGDAVAEILGSYPNDSGTVGRVFSALIQAPLFELPHPGFTTIAVADVDGAGLPEILMAGSRFGAYRYDGSGTAATVFQMTLPNDTGAVTLAVANLDRAQDARPEFAMGTYFDTIHIADFPDTGVAIEWSSAELEPLTPQTLSGPFFGGALARGASNPPAPLFLTPATGVSHGTRLFTMSPDTGDLSFGPELPQSSSWQTSSDLVVVDYDHDGIDEAFFASADVLDTYFGVYDYFAEQLEFRSEVFATSPAVDIAHGDLNGDGREDLVALAENGFVHAYDPFTGSLIWREQLPPGGAGVAVANLDGTGGPEIVVATSTQVIAYSRDADPSSPFARRYESGDYLFVRDLAVGDADGDGAIDVFLAHGGFGYHVQRLNERLEPTTSFDVDTEIESLAIEESAFARKNLLATVWAPAGSTMRAMDPQSGAEIWRSPPIYGSITPNSVHFVDPAGDGVLRIAYGTAAGVFLTR